MHFKKSLCWSTSYSLFSQGCKLHMKIVYYIDHRCQCYKTFSSSLPKRPKKLPRLPPGKSLQPGLTFAGKARSLPYRRAPERCSTCEGSVSLAIAYPYSSSKCPIITIFASKTESALVDHLAVPLIKTVETQPYLEISDQPEKLVGSKHSGLF